MEARSIVALGPRVPEMLGNFHLDDHNVEEWSDATNPGVRHKARKEIGKWIDPESNADIQYQKREDCKQSDRTQEQTRTEVIHGQAPDSTFQIVRSHTQFQDVGGNKSNSRVQSSSTSYQMSSSSGVRSTSKSTSNRTTTKTVTVSGGGRTDDFENLNMSFQPLDTSTQRERINVSRSGTMGVRRPPTRRHTPAAAISSSPEDLIDTRDEIIVDSDDNMRNTPDLPTITKVTDPERLSIIGFKNISPKIRVGFPVEIQLELQTKLRSSSNMGRDNDEEIRGVVESSITKPSVCKNTYHQASKTIRQDTCEEIEQMERITSDSAIPLFELSANNEDSTFDFQQRRKSYGFESFDSHTRPAQRTRDHSVAVPQRDNIRFPDDTANHVMYHHPITTNHKIDYGLKTFSDDSSEISPIRSDSQFPGLSPSSISRSWDLIQSAVTAQERREANKKLFHSTTTNSKQQSYVMDKSSSHTDSFSRVKPAQTTTVNLNTLDESQPVDSLGNDHKGIYRLDSLDSIISSRSIFPSKDITPFANLDETETQIDCTPDVLHHEASVLSPSLERSRKLLKMLDETPDLLHKMSYKNYFSEGLKSEGKHWDEKGDASWGTERQLSFLNDSLTRILEDGRNKETRSYDKTGHDTDSSNWINDDHSRLLTDNTSISRHETFLVDDAETDINGNVKGRVGQVSQTWITSGEQKPSQTVRDKDVTTSISATNDIFKRGPKKVEFCKTEVHFTADSGKVHIVETDENKPSTSHLFRKKKKGDKGKQSSTTSSDHEESGKSEMQTNNTEVDQEVEMGGNSTEDAVTEREGRELKSGVGVLDGLLLFQHRISKEIKSEQAKTISRAEPPPTVEITSTQNSLANRNAQATSYTRREQIIPSKSLPMLPLLRDNLNDECEVFETSHIIMNDVGGDDVIQSPSHMILSNYGEMKIQRYLKQLKSPSSNNGSESSNEPSEFVPDDPSHFRFDNVLYEHGSFVPLATRRSLIEMNNRNRKRNITSHISDNSSTTSTYSLPNSDKDNSASTYQPLRLARMEAKVATARAKPQITSVELHYELENNERPSNPELILNRENHLNFRQKTENIVKIPSPVMPLQMNNTSIRRNKKSSFSSSPEEPQSSQEMHRNAKPPTPIHPEDYTIDEKETELRDRYYYKNPSYEYNESNLDDQFSRSQKNEFTMSASSVITTAHNKGSSKSIVTIGDYGTARSEEDRRVLTSNDYPDQEDAYTPEPVLSMDHTWKGPAHFDNQSSASKATSVVRSLTFPKSSRSEPEWVSKARSREARVMDWDLIGKQVETGPTKTEPPWMDEIIRHRSKSTTSEDVKTLPKISVVYPWQRDSGNPKPLGEDGSPEMEEIEERSHIVSIVPTPPMLSMRKESDRGSHFAKTTTILQSTKLSESGLPVLHQSKRKIVDRDSDSIVINPAQILKQAELTESKTKGKLRFENQVQLLDDSRNVVTVTKSSGQQPPGVQEHTKSTVPSKPKQSSKAAFKEYNANKGDSNVKIHKNPKPPQRISSLVKAETELNQISGKSSKSQTLQKDKTPRRGIIKKSDMEESSSQSYTPIHRHPTVQVSKLPIRKNVPSKAAESKPISTSFVTRVKNKDKHHVTENLEPKQSGKPQTKAGGNSPTPDPTTLKSQKPGESRHVTQKMTGKPLASNKKK